MRLAIFGASGWIGGTVAREALERGHDVTAVVRDPARLKLTHGRLTVVTGDVTDWAGIASIVAGHDAVAAAISGRRDKDHGVVSTAAHALLAGLVEADVNRLVWVGGAGSLEVSPGGRLIDTPQFPAEWKEEAMAQVEALELFRTAKTDVEWSFFSPAALIEPGKRTGQFRTGGDQLLTNDKGESRISVEDFAVALVDEIENPAHIRQRFTAAY